MDEGSFDQNFTWFEWGFVDPGDVQPTDAGIRRDTGSSSVATVPWHRGAERPMWDEDQRWST